MALRFEPYGNPLAGQALKQAQYNQLNDTLMGISRQGIQESQFNREQALRQAAEDRAKFIHDRTYSPMPGDTTQQEEPSHRDYTGLFSDSQPQNPLSLNPSVVQPMGQQDMPTRPMMGPAVSPIVTQHLQDNPHFSDVSPYGPKPGQSRADYAEQQSWKTADLGNQKTMADISEAQSKGKLYESQADYYRNRNPNSEFELKHGEKEDQLTQKRIKQLGDDLDPSRQRSGAFGVSKQVYDRAERLESLANAIPDGNLDRRQIEELAIGLNAMLSGSNVGAQSQVKALVPKTALGDSAKFVEWFSSDPTGANQQAFVHRMMDSVSREKQTAYNQMNRTRFSRIAKYGDLEQKSPELFYSTLRANGVNPEDYSAWAKGGYKDIDANQKNNGSGSQITVGRFKVTAH